MSKESFYLVTVLLLFFQSSFCYLGYRRRRSSFTCKTRSYLQLLNIRIVLKVLYLQQLQLFNGKDFVQARVPDKHTLITLCKCSRVLYQKSNKEHNQMPMLLKFQTRKQVKFNYLNIYFPHKFLSSSAGVPRTGGWSTWSEWSTCQCPSNIPSKSRSRSCTSPSASCGGRTCSGDTVDIAICLDLAVHGG